MVDQIRDALRGSIPNKDWLLQHLRPILPPAMFADVVDLAEGRGFQAPTSLLDQGFYERKAARGMAMPGAEEHHGQLMGVAEGVLGATGAVSEETLRPVTGLGLAAYDQLARTSLRALPEGVRQAPIPTPFGPKPLASLLFQGADIDAAPPSLTREALTEYGRNRARQKLGGLGEFLYDEATDIGNYAPVGVIAKGAITTGRELKAAGGARALLGAAMEQGGLGGQAWQRATENIGADLLGGIGTIVHKGTQRVPFVGPAVDWLGSKSARSLLNRDTSQVTDALVAQVSNLAEGETARDWLAPLTGAMPKGKAGWSWLGRGATDLEENLMALVGPQRKIAAARLLNAWHVDKNIVDAESARDIAEARKAARLPATDPNHLAPDELQDFLNGRYRRQQDAQRVLQMSVQESVEQLRDAPFDMTNITPEIEQQAATMFDDAMAQVRNDYFTRRDQAKMLPDLIDTAGPDVDDAVAGGMDMFYREARLATAATASKMADDIAGLLPGGLDEASKKYMDGVLGTYITSRDRLMGQIGPLAERLGPVGEQASAVIADQGVALQAAQRRVVAWHNRLNSQAIPILRRAIDAKTLIVAPGVTADDAIDAAMENSYTLTRALKEVQALSRQTGLPGEDTAAIGKLLKQMGEHITHGDVLQGGDWLPLTVEFWRRAHGPGLGVTPDRGWLAAFNGAMNVWKGTALLSPTFHSANLIFGLFSGDRFGVSPVETMKNLGRGMSEIHQQVLKAYANTQEGFDVTAPGMRGTMDAYIHSIVTHPDYVPRVTGDSARMQRAFGRIDRNGNAIFPTTGDTTSSAIDFQGAVPRGLGGRAAWLGVSSGLGLASGAVSPATSEEERNEQMVRGLLQGAAIGTVTPTMLHASKLFLLAMEEAFKKTAIDVAMRQRMVGAHTVLFDQIDTGLVREVETISRPVLRGGTPVDSAEALVGGPIAEVVRPKTTPTLPWSQPIAGSVPTTGEARIAQHRLDLAVEKRSPQTGPDLLTVSQADAAVAAAEKALAGKYSFIRTGGDSGTRQEYNLSQARRMSDDDRRLLLDRYTVREDAIRARRTGPPPAPAAPPPGPTPPPSPPSPPAGPFPAGPAPASLLTPTPATAPAGPAPTTLLPSQPLALPAPTVPAAAPEAPLTAQQRRAKILEEQDARDAVLKAERDAENQRIQDAVAVKHTGITDRERDAAKETAWQVAEKDASVLADQAALVTMREARDAAQRAHPRAAATRKLEDDYSDAFLRLNEKKRVLADAEYERTTGEPARQRAGMATRTETGRPTRAADPKVIGMTRAAFADKEQAAYVATVERDLAALKKATAKDGLFGPLTRFKTKKAGIAQLTDDLANAGSEASRDISYQHHRQEVRHALETGADVAPEVLADYPDLAPAAAAAPATPAARPRLTFTPGGDWPNPAQAQRDLDKANDTPGFIDEVERLSAEGMWPGEIADVLDDRFDMTTRGMVNLVRKELRIDDPNTNSFAQWQAEYQARQPAAAAAPTPAAPAVPGRRVVDFSYPTAPGRDRDRRYQYDPELVTPRVVLRERDDPRQNYNVLEWDVAGGPYRDFDQVFPEQVTEVQIQGRSQPWRKITRGREPGILYRGIHGAEMDAIKASGVVQSRGDLNIGETQAGVTMYSPGADTAYSYAAQFAPVRYQSTVGGQPNYLLKVRDPGVEFHDRAAVPVNTENEVALRQPVPVDEIVAVYEVRTGVRDVSEAGHESHSHFQVRQLSPDEMADVLGRPAPSKAATPTAPEYKHPHEMTLEQFFTRTGADKVHWGGRNGPPIVDAEGEVLNRAQEAALKRVLVRNHHEALDPSLDRSHLKPVEQRRLAEYDDAALAMHEHQVRVRPATQVLFHKGYVQGALEEGKEVAPEVLAAYPDLAAGKRPKRYNIKDGMRMVRKVQPAPAAAESVAEAVAEAAPTTATALVPYQPPIERVPYRAPAPPPPDVTTPAGPTPTSLMSLAPRTTVAAPPPGAAAPPPGAAPAPPAPPLPPGTRLAEWMGDEYAGDLTIGPQPTPPRTITKPPPAGALDKLKLWLASNIENDILMVSPREVMDKASGLGIDPELARQLGGMWDGQIYEGEQAGLALYRQIHGDYGDVSRLVEFLRRTGIFPFMTWGSKQAPNMVTWLIQDPRLAIAIDRFNTISEREAEEAGLPARFAGLVSTGQLGDAIAEHILGIPDADTMVSPLGLLPFGNVGRIFEEDEPAPPGVLKPPLQRPMEQLGAAGLGVGPLPQLAGRLTGLTEDYGTPILRTSQYGEALSGIGGGPQVQPEQIPIEIIRTIRGSMPGQERQRTLSGNAMRDYAIRQRIAQEAYEKTGKPAAGVWLEYMDDPKSAMWKKHERAVERESAGQMTLAASVPLRTRPITDFDRTVAAAKLRAGTRSRDLAELTPEEVSRRFVAARATAPLSLAYSRLAGTDKVTAERMYSAYRDQQKKWRGMSQLRRERARTEYIESRPLLGQFLAEHGYR